MSLKPARIQQMWAAEGGPVPKGSRVVVKDMAVRIKYNWVRILAQPYSFYVTWVE